jgi:hypothetical protein
MKYTTKSLKITSAAPAKRLNQYLKASQTPRDDRHLFAAKPYTKQSLLISAHEYHGLCRTNHERR